MLPKPPPPPNPNPGTPNVGTEVLSCNAKGLWPESFGPLGLPESIEAFCKEADYELIANNRFYKKLAIRVLSKRVAIMFGILGKNNCSFRIDAGTCMRILARAALECQSGSMWGSGGRIESNCAVWTVDPVLL